MHFKIIYIEPECRVKNWGGWGKEKNYKEKHLDIYLFVVDKAVRILGYKKSITILFIFVV